MKYVSAALLLVVCLLSFSMPAHAQDTADVTLQNCRGIDQCIEAGFAPISFIATSVMFYSVYWQDGGLYFPPLIEAPETVINGARIPFIVMWLMLASLSLTLYFGFINLRGLRHSYHVLRGEFDSDKNQGQVNRFQVLATELSGTVGLENISGVAIAISIGGPGATLWMILMGFFGMTTKFVEAALGVKYRIINKNGRINGGPMYYLRDGLRERGWRFVGKAFAALFAVCCIGGAIGGGNMYQANQAFSQFVEITGGDSSPFTDKGWLFGLVLAVLVGVVILGGIQSIARVAEKIVPFMGGIYVLAALVVIGIHAEAIPEALGTIFQQAFAPTALTGGTIGAIVAGVQRALFSNEAGIGSAAIAHAATRTDKPVSEGFIGMLGPVVDTLIICTLTALVITVTGVYENYDGITGIRMTSNAFAQGISWFPYVLALAVFLFAFSTMLAWSYYGSKCFAFLFGERRSLEIGFRLLFCAFVVVGSAVNLSNVIGFTDALFFAMSVPNVIGLYLLAPKLKRELRDYWSIYGKKEKSTQRSQASLAKSSGAQASA